MKKFCLCLIMIFSVLQCAGDLCAHLKTADDTGVVLRRSVKVGVSKSVIKDISDSPLWKNIPEYNLMHNVTDARHINLLPSERAVVRYLCDPEHLFVRVDAQDSDIMTCASKNNQFHYKMGDLVEVFAKPKDHPCFWEFYGTPNGYYTCFYFKSRGTLNLPSSFTPGKVKIGVISKIDGTLNKHSDRDKLWQVIIVIPRAELEKNGCSFSAPQRWTLLTARYNYGRYISYNERSAYPQVANGYHANQHYADVEFIDLDHKEK